MRLKNKAIEMRGVRENIKIKRNEHGIPVIQANNFEDAYYAMGWIHANDRQLQMMVTRILLRGEACEKLKASKILLEVDKYIRKMNFQEGLEKEIEKLEPDIKKQIQAYVNGVNNFLKNHKTVYELRLLGYKHEPWTILDSMLIGKIFGFVGLADSQGAVEKLIIHMIHNGISEAKIKELFPYMKENINSELLKKINLTSTIIPKALKWLPKFNASNNWVVSGKRTKSGKPIFSGDPHLETNRLPAIWNEAIIQMPDNKIIGVSIPGVPGIVMGRTNSIAWSATYSFMDMLDFKIEHCKEGKYRRGDQWYSFKKRRETIRSKKGKDINIDFFDTDTGVLEGTPDTEGYYLRLDWSARKGTGANEFNRLLKMASVKNVKEAMENVKYLDCASFNWVIADIEGNIGYQMSGRLFERAQGVSGLLPIPAWDEKEITFVDPNKLPSLYNPPEGFIVTANNDLNFLGEVSPITLPMGSYRADRIKQCIEEKDTGFEVDTMKEIQADLYSLQAEKLMKIIIPFLPDCQNGTILKNWDMRYDLESKGAMLFEEFYNHFLHSVFADNGFGHDILNYILTETGMFSSIYQNFDTILLDENSEWFSHKSRKQCIEEALKKTLVKKAKKYKEVRQFMFGHLLFGNHLPKFLGYDRGPYALPGSRATIPQGQIFKVLGRKTTFAPSYRMIVDMATNEMHTNISGGPSDRRFSKWYASDLDNWYKKIYKILK